MRQKVFGWQIFGKRRRRRKKISMTTRIIEMKPKRKYPTSSLESRFIV
jgi:hypothetical protein